MQNLNYSLVETNQIVSELEDLFENLPRLCIKQNATGWGSNQRILFVKDKKLIYARNYQGFKEGAVTQIPQNHIKSFVNIEDIYQVNYLPVDKLQKKTISILIPQKRINQQSLMNSSFVNPKGTQNSVQIIETKNENNEQQKAKFIKWIFHFQYDLKQKLQQIRAIKKEQQRKKNLLNLASQKQPQNELQFSRKIADESQQNHSFNGLNESQQQQLPLRQYVNQIKKAKDYIKFKETRQKQEKQQRRKKKPNQEKFQDYDPFSKQQENFPIMNHWRQYFSAIQDIFNNKVPQRSIYECELILYKLIHTFKETCLNIFKNYIFEKINGINGEKWKFEDFYFYKGIWIKLGGKQLNQEFMMYYNIADLANLLNKNLKIPYRVPNICLIDYMGFKALCMCDLPFTEIQKSQVYSIFNQTYDLQNISKIKDHLSRIEKTLNLKTEQIQKNNNKKMSVPLGSRIRIFEYNPKKDIKNDQSTIQNFYYITNLQNILPLDFNFQLQKPNLDCRFRPQLIGDIRQILQIDYDQNTQLLSTAFMVSNMNQQLKTREDDKIVKTSRFLLKQRIPQFTQKLNNSQLILVDSYSLKMYMSQFGINTRYMYKIYQLSKIRYIREVIEVQCLARTIKRIFYEGLKQLTTIIFNQRKVERDNQIIQLDVEKSQTNFPSIQVKFKEDQEKINQNTLDFLNLIFGIGQQSYAFWKILCQKTHKNFKVKVQYPFQGSAGSLLHAVLYHCGISAVFDVEIPLFKVQHPFSKQNEVTLHAKSKTLQFPSFQIQKLIRSVPDIARLDHPNIELLENIALKLFKLDLLKNYYLYEGQNSYNLTFSRLNLVKDQLQKPRNISSNHPSQISFYIKNKSQANFERGLNLLRFCYSDFHPLYISFYQQYSKVYQPQLLKKTSILHSIKVFGQFHPRTSQLYSNVYGEGYKQFYQKSLRTQGILASKKNATGQFESGKYLSCMEYCFKQIQMSQKDETRIKKQNCVEYLEILFMGMKSAIQISQLKEALKISDSISDLLNKFKLRNYLYHYELVHDILKMKLILAPEKLFIYKMALLSISTRQKFNENVQKDPQGRAKPAQGKEKEVLATGIMNEYFTHDTHSLWLDNILKHLLASYQYFNHLDDLFNNFEYHIKKYDNMFFVQSFGYLDILVRLYGQNIFKQYLYEVGNV